MFFGCSGGSSGTQAEPRLFVLNFNQNRQPSVLMNSPLVFTFSAPVDPATVNSNTLQIWTNIQGKRVDAQGAFEVNGATVTWFPSMTSKVYPLDVASLPPNSAILPSDAGLNTLDRAILSYQVLVLASPSPSVVRSVTGNPVQEAFSSSFDTIQGPQIFSPGNSTVLQPIFDPRAPFFRDTIRVADVLAYSGTLIPSGGFRGDWLQNPGSTGGENPLYIAPSYLPAAKGDWVNRDRTGELVDAMFGIGLVPPMTESEMQDNEFPVGMPRTDERFISNKNGVKKGRTVPVTGLNIFFTQPLAADSFLTATNAPKPINQSPISVKVLPNADTDPATMPKEDYALSYLNDTDLQAGWANITLTKPVTTGWVFVSVIGSGVKGMPGGNLEQNFGAEFFYIWPVLINAQ
jgi:hypothetical protein